MEVNEGKFNKKSKIRILVSPLNWGLGHASRCIPIIKELLANDCEVMVAAERECMRLIKKEFPQINYLSLPAYDISYTKKGSQLKWKLLLQLPFIANTIYKEHKWLKKTIRSNNIAAVISDNRFGLHTTKIPSVYITHQLLIKTGSSFWDKFFQRRHYSIIKKYSKCWVPDESENGIAGELSHPVLLPANIQYIGLISRLEKAGKDILYDILIIMSGPEPQRTILEEILLQQIINLDKRIVLVRGSEDADTIGLKPNIIKILHQANARELNELILQSEVVVSRCGYSTVMDLIKLQKKAILIPTPGQTEQEYLAEKLMKEGVFYCAEQDKLILKDALKYIKENSFSFPEYNWEGYKDAVREFVREIAEKRKVN